ncbi:hypothetical protein FVR03_03670 [Pontibacter qinzhouensis]|uniref:Glycosyltransferase RgtA/B/C/D-like domain-containing protein n=1 Tax=Pontibacter qinzhouensis TaxID=2603253 RepID=A0A5C8KE89_9BACT|nr:hypothetical protein [Pontibacter qinzhouensis]TXK51320.1 hypothetical protein FVR03_03670 [Pontibacter qinzhouensis]
MPSRLILLVLLYLAIRVPLILLGVPATVPELKFMLIGERMADGFAMYREIYDSTAPLAALVYWLIDLVAGRSYLTYRLVAAALLLAQALLLNSTFIRNKVYAESNYLPALLYLTFGCLTLEFEMLTPLLLGNTFVILSLPYFITVAREGLDNSRLFIGGFMLGLAALSFLPLGLFLLLGLFAVILFASAAFRSSLLMLCGFAFPYAMLLSYYLFTGAVGSFLELHLLRPWQFEVSFLIPPADLAKLLVLPGLVLALSLFSMLSLAQRLVFQVKFQQLMVVWLIVSLLVIISRDQVSAASFLVLLPPLAYFSEFLFTSRFKPWILSLMYLVLLAGVVVLRYRQPLGIGSLVKIDESRILLPVSPAQAIKGASVLVLGNDITYYTHNTLATPYLNWQLAQRHFGRLNEYDAVFALYRNFKKEPPRYIIDKVGLLEELKYKLPTIFDAYEPTDVPAVYKRQGKEL